MRRLLKAIGDRRLKSARRRYGADAGDAARHHNHWDTAIAHYRRYLQRRPNDIGIQVRLANTLRESGNLSGAITLLREIVAVRPDNPRFQLMLAELFDEAGSFLEADEARRRLMNAGGVASNSQEPRLAVANPCPPVRFSGRVLVAIHVRPGEERRLSITLSSLRSLTAANWSVLLSGEFDADLVNELRNKNPRISLRVMDAAYDQESEAILKVRVGSIVTDDLIDWLFWAFTEGVSAAYCDHEEIGDDGSRHVILQSSPHVLDLATNPKPPAFVLFRSGFRDEACQEAAVGLFTAFQSGVVRHVPLTLGSAPERQRNWGVDRPSIDGPEGGGRLLVVIPTRDEAYALDGMLNSLLERASDKARIDIVVVDNGSQEPATLKILESWRLKGVEILRLDEPFNWSKLNNDACEGRAQPIVVFANNDMEMLSDGWDLEVHRLLALEGVGVVGARLLYPNGRVQHAGIVMGALSGEPLHEGLRAAEDDTGPLNRWVRQRPATAVTGAFMAVRRSVFDQVGGFDAVNFAVSCNDVDFCLRARQAGWTVLYAPTLQLRHHESLSRGHSNTHTKQQRAEEEMTRLLDRWGSCATFDPTRNPQWRGRGIRLFAEMRDLTAEEVMDWVVKTESRPRFQGDKPTLP